jgi:hypothetical protein
LSLAIARDNSARDDKTESHLKAEGRKLWLFIITSHA